MAVSIRNVEKFVDEHPKLVGKRKEEILAGAKKLSRKGIISAGVVEDFMGNLTEQFFQEVTTNMDHVQIGLTDLGKHS